MKKLIALLCLLAIVWGCGDVEFSNCGEVTAENTVWLQEAIEERQDDIYAWIKRADYQGNDVLVFGNCCPNCGSIFSVYSCDGQLLGYLGNEIELEEVTNYQLFWKPSNSACDFD
ncbi:MAG TPA: hypothetical protein VIN11_02600 [Roseivirga sp.]